MLLAVRVSQSVNSCPNDRGVVEIGHPLDLCFARQEEQIELLSCLVAGDNVTVLKARQIGNTTAILLYFFWVWFTAREPVRIVILSHKEKASKKLLRDMIKTAYRALPADWKRELEVNNTTEMMLADTGALISAEGGQGDGGMRSGNCQYLLLTEAAFVPDAKEL